MLGPVFNAEMLRAGRRWWWQLLRRIYAGWLCLQLVYVYDSTHAEFTYGMPPQAPVSRLKAAANFGQQFRDLVIGQQFMLIVLVTPAFVAGTITDEKTRGTLQGLLTAYITPADIVLGKLAARVAQVGILALTPLPLLAFVGQYAGVTPEFLLALLAITLLLLFGLGGASMLASVWVRQTRGAVLATYFGLFAGYFLIRYGWVTGAWTDYFGLIRVLDPLVNREDPAEAFRRLMQATMAWGGLGVITTSLAVWRLRPAYLRQMEARPRRARFQRLTARTIPARDVVAWKERRVGRRVPVWLGVPLTCLATAAVVGYVVQGMTIPAWRGGAAYVLMQVGVYSFLLATLMVGVRCSGSITGERETRHLGWLDDLAIDGPRNRPRQAPWRAERDLAVSARRLVRGDGRRRHCGPCRSDDRIGIRLVRGRRRRTGDAVRTPCAPAGCGQPGIDDGRDRRMGRRHGRRDCTWLHLGGDALPRRDWHVLLGQIEESPGEACSAQWFLDISAGWRS